MRKIHLRQRPNIRGVGEDKAVEAPKTPVIEQKIEAVVEKVKKAIKKVKKK